MAESTKEREERLEKLLEAVNDASRNVRAAFLTFLVAGLYFAILIGSTTDEQLLKESGIVLPLLSVELPIVGFYIIAPWLFWLLHLNLLLLLRLLAGKIDRLPMRLPETFRHRLHTFPFTQLRAGPRQAGAARFLLWAMAWISIVALPVIVLMWAQARFLAYHGDWITFFHQLAVLADLALLWLLWPRAAASKGLVKALGYAVSIVLSLLLAAFSLFDAVVPEGPWENNVGRLYPGNLLEKVFGGRVRYLDLAEKTLVLEEAPPEILAAYIASKRDGEMKAARLGHTRGLDLHDRDLRNADLSVARLDKADLREARLQGANLGLAKLQGADLRGAKLQGANLSGAELQGAALFDAELQGADLSGASLGGARLFNVDLRAANLRDVNFNKLTTDEWKKLKDEIAAAVPAGVKRKRALKRIGTAMKTETTIVPLRAEGAIYDPRVPELADLPKQWPPLDRGAYRLSELRLGILTGIACDGGYAAAGIARRAIEIALFDDPHLAGALLEQECQAIRALPEDLKAKLREAAEGADKP